MRCERRFGVKSLIPLRPVRHGKSEISERFARTVNAGPACSNSRALPPRLRGYREQVPHNRSTEHRFARIGFMRALNRHVERVFDPSRKDLHWDGESSRGTHEN
jgi:hypothetical protein